MSIVCSCRNKFRPSSYHHQLGVSHPKAPALHVALRTTAGQRADNRVLTAGDSSLPKSPIDERCLHATTTKFRQRSGTKQGGNSCVAQNRAHASTSRHSIQKRKEVHASLEIG